MAKKHGRASLLLLACLHVRWICAVHVGYIRLRALYSYEGLLGCGKFSSPSVTAAVVSSRFGSAVGALVLLALVKNRYTAVVYLPFSKKVVLESRALVECWLAGWLEGCDGHLLGRLERYYAVVLISLQAIQVFLLVDLINI